MCQSSFQIVVDKRSFPIFKLGSIWSLDIHWIVSFSWLCCLFQISIFIYFVLYFYHLIILIMVCIYLFRCHDMIGSRWLFFLSLSISWLLLLEYPIEGLLRLLLLWINYFSWAGGRPCFKRNSVEISVKFQVLEYFFKFRVHDRSG